MSLALSTLNSLVPKKCFKLNGFVRLCERIKLCFECLNVFKMQDGDRLLFSFQPSLRGELLQVEVFFWDY